LSGLEFEARQELGKLWEPISGLSTGGNLTLIDARVNLPDSEILAFEALYGERPRSTRDMTSAPSYLYNLFLTYDVEATGSQFGIFYTVQGETLLSGASVSPYIPATYQTRFGTLNLSLTQKLGDGLRLSFAAKNLTDAEHREVYRSDYVTGDVLRRRGTDGIEYSLTLGGEYHF
jgi:outer membrane receptor protein involved in Fe transport